MLQRAWNHDPQSLPFAPYIRTHALVSLVQKGLQYHELEQSFDKVSFFCFWVICHAIVHCHFVANPRLESNVCSLGGKPHLIYPGQLFLWSSLAGFISHASLVTRSRRCSCSHRARPSSPGVCVAYRWQGWDVARQSRHQRPPDNRGDDDPAQQRENHAQRRSLHH